jgi:hypothetical protein
LASAAQLSIACWTPVTQQALDWAATIAATTAKFPNLNAFPARQLLPFGSASKIRAFADSATRRMQYLSFGEQKGDRQIRNNRVFEDVVVIILS